jgi:uncharacterized integral membrane protein
MGILKTVLIVVLIALVIIVMVQNAQPITFRFLNWTYQVSQLLLVTIVFVVGFLVGLVTGKVTGRRKEDEPPLTTRPR